MKRYSAEEIEFMDKIAFNVMAIFYDKYPATSISNAIDLSQDCYIVAKEMLFERNKLINEVTK